MNYYIQGNKEKADQIKAAFEKLGVASNANRYNYKNDYVLYFSAGGMMHMIDTNSSWANIIKTHPDYKELKLPKPHYNIANFKPFDRVLVRCSNDEEWMIEFYCKYDTLVHTSPHRDYPFMGIGDSYSQCIPYNDDTMHLLGTTDMCPEEYINW